MTDTKTKALRDAELAFNATVHGTEKEKVALEKWRDLCETEEEEQIPISAYLRRETNRKRNRSQQKQTTGVINNECLPETQSASKTEKRRGKKSVRPHWWENY